MRVSPIIGRAGAGKSYDQWLAHLRADRGTIAEATPTTGALLGNYLVHLSAAPTLNLTGSPWMGSFLRGGGSTTRALGRIVQHALPSEAALNSQVSNSGRVLIVTSDNPSGAQPSVTRNGYTSTAGGTSNSTKVAEASYWDWLINAPMTMDPFAGTGPVPYSAPGW